MEKSVVQLYTCVVHCARPFVDDASLITTVPLKTGGNTAGLLNGAEPVQEPELISWKRAVGDLSVILEGL